LHIISRKKLLQAVERFRESRSLSTQLDAWYRTAKSARWKTLDDVRQTYSHADGVPAGEKVFTVFNIGGNNFRLITEIFYEDQTVLIRDVLRHDEYDKENWKK
jgi:mRNA interferase HigB